MAANGHRGAKHSGSEALLKALMLRMDTMDQAIASLEAQPSFPVEVPSDQVNRPGVREYCLGRHSPRFRRGYFSYRFGGAQLAGTSEGDVMEQARCLVSYLGTGKGSHGSQEKGQGLVKWQLIRPEWVEEGGSLLPELLRIITCGTLPVTYKMGSTCSDACKLTEAYRMLQPGKEGCHSKGGREQLRTFSQPRQERRSSPIDACEEEADTITEIQSKEGTLAKINRCDFERRAMTYAPLHLLGAAASDSVIFQGAS
ncbi:hypothetical protein NDU88_005824 [Pleurodeles waltl]|uniref:Uncharacterized protein n=1 Tax=Pleurodeles waltl TaxID=8319 RepID=A0AAV7PGJ4_PLEWA|nr:hypothetical protein NDU88_005824 [Pleurodeles waltl]